MKIVNVLVAVAVVVFLSVQVAALVNPAAAYCERLGYKYVMEETPAGTAGYCQMPDGEMCLPSEFMRGTCGRRYNYCSIKNLHQLTTNQPGLCRQQDICVVCQLPNGTYVDAIQAALNDRMFGSPDDLQDLVLTVATTTTTQASKIVCGNLVCEPGEDNSCPTDCVPPAPKESTMTLILGVLVLLVVVAAAVELHERKLAKKGKTRD
jgi:putative hemolysin